jgi:hypothetical protein
MSNNCRPSPEFSLTSCQTPGHFLRFGTLLCAELTGALVTMAANNARDRLQPQKHNSNLARVAITSPEHPQVFVA